MDSLPEELRKEIRDARIAKGWSQLEFGDKVGLAQKHVSGIETGKIVPRFDTLLDVKRILDWDIVAVPRALTPIVDAMVRDHRRGTEDPDAGDRPLYAVDDGDDEH